jgi:hypothetical protein
LAWYDFVEEVLMLRGGCMCGQYRYEIKGDTRCETLCHCSMCRHSAGAPAVAWLTVARSNFSVLTGSLTCYRSSGEAWRSFCPRCGTQVLFESDKSPDELDVTLGSLDDANARPPRDHTRTATRVTWWGELDNLPEFADTRDG